MLLYFYSPLFTKVTCKGIKLSRVNYYDVGNPNLPADSHSNHLARWFRIIHFQFESPQCEFHVHATNSNQCEFNSLYFCRVDKPLLTTNFAVKKSTFAIVASFIYWVRLPCHTRFCNQILPHDKTGQVSSLKIRWYPVISDAVVVKLLYWCSKHTVVY